MKPAARVQAAIELAAAIEAAALEDGPSAVEVSRDFFRRRRYAGAKDRRAVTGLAYDAVRYRAGDIWRLMQAGAEPSIRLRVALRLAETGDDWHAEFAGDGPYGPAAMTAAESAAVETAQTTDLLDAPDWARLGFPEWLGDELRRRFGADLAPEMKALTGPAPLDLRVNTLKLTLKDAAHLLHSDGIMATATPLSPIGLRTVRGAPVRETPAFKSGHIEIQDEGAQLAALLCAARPGDQVVDFCAGAGGKTLALAALKGNRGQIYAADPDSGALNELRSRAKRADARNIQTIALSEKGRDRLAELAGTADVVLVDAPCSGTGTWRRHPEQPWRLMPERLEDFVAAQKRILSEASTLVRPGGRLVYVTCSVLPAENEAVIAAFLSDNAGWSIQPFDRLWPTFSETPPPPTLSSEEGCLQLTPGTHGTDGFFIAVLRAPN